MRNYLFSFIFLCVLSCKRDQPLPPLKPAYIYPELKGIWYVQNAYPFWNIDHTQSTGCVGMSENYFIDSVSPTKYVVYEWVWSGINYNRSVRVDMQLDTLTDSLYCVYGHDTQFYNPFITFFKLNLKYERSNKAIIGEIGVISPVGCVTLPTDSFQGNTIWRKY